MSVILLGIDGTGGGVFPGKKRDENYDEAFADSFVKRLTANGVGMRRYFRGPVALGGGLHDAISGGYSWVKQLKRINETADILLTGYSRGAAGAVMVAKRLKSDNISVKAMLLFDCVDRYLFGDASVVPENVENVKHVIRDPSAKSRLSFGNDALKFHRNSTNYLPVVKFMCTHGGMGGTPWEKPAGKYWTDFIEEGALERPYTRRTNVTYLQDRQVSVQVWAHCETFMREYGFR